MKKKENRAWLRQKFEEAVSEDRIHDRHGSISGDDVLRLEHELKDRGMQKGHAVGLSLDNGRLCISYYIALANIGAVAVPLPAAMPFVEKMRLWKGIGCAATITADGVTAFDLSLPGPVWSDDIGWIVHSSGSTGIPKAIPISIQAAARNAEDVARFLKEAGLQARVHLGTMSQCYTSGLYNAFLIPALTGGSVVIGPVASALRIAELASLVEQFTPDIIWVNPTVLALLAKRSTANTCAHSEVFISCTAPLTKDDCLRAEAHFKKPVLQSYGLSETLIVTIEHPNRNAESEYSAGNLISGSESAQVTPAGQILVTNGAVMQGYASLEGGSITFKMPEGSVSEQSFQSGDIGFIESGSRMFLTGRRSNVINVEGVKVSPEQLEQILREHPLVLDACVARVVDANSRERPVGLIVGRDQGSGIDMGLLSDKCAAELGPKARPAALYLVSDLPMTANGKLDRPAAEKKARDIHATS